MRSLNNIVDELYESGVHQDTMKLYHAVWDTMMEIPAFDGLKDANFAKIAGALSANQEFAKQASGYLEDDGTYNFDPNFIKNMAWKLIQTPPKRDK